MAREKGEREPFSLLWIAVGEKRSLRLQTPRGRKKGKGEKRADLAPCAQGKGGSRDVSTPGEKKGDPSF